MMRNSKWLSNGEKQAKCTVKKLRTMTASLKQGFPKLREFCVACLTRGWSLWWSPSCPPGAFLNGVTTGIDWWNLDSPAEQAVITAVSGKLFYLHLSLIKALSFARDQKTIQGTPRMPMGVPGMGNESKLALGLDYMTESLSGMMMKRNEDRLYPFCAVQLISQKANTSDVSSKHRVCQGDKWSEVFVCFGGRWGGSWEWSLVPFFFPLSEQE